MIKRRRLSERIFFKGTTDDVASVLQTGDVFVFPSAFEGFGLTLAEAMSMGLSVVGCKSCVAANELIQDGVDGLLAEEGADGLAQSTGTLMKDQALRVKMGKAARASMRKYEASVIWTAWEDLLNTCSRR